MSQTDPLLQSSAEGAEIQLSGHILSVSAGMVGVCLTVIGLFRVVQSTHNVDSVADDLLAGDALIFLVSCFVAYLALRARSQARRSRLERVADTVFLAGLNMMVVVGGLVAYELI